MSRDDEVSSKKSGNSSVQHQSDNVKSKPKTVQSTLQRWTRSAPRKDHDDDDDVPKIPKRQIVPKSPAPPPTPAPETTLHRTHTVYSNQTSATSQKDVEIDDNAAISEAVIVTSNSPSVIN